MSDTTVLVSQSRCMFIWRLIGAVQLQSNSESDVKDSSALWTNHYLGEAGDSFCFSSPIGPLWCQLPHSVPANGEEAKAFSNLSLRKGEGERKTPIDCLWYVITLSKQTE